MTTRRYDIDWLRSIAIFLLMFYHAAIVFQPWAEYVGFVTSPDYLLGLWTAMEAMNIWRIPLLFFVSGMGLYFSMQNRGLVALLKERGIRIGIPLVFGVFCIVPLYILILLAHQYDPLTYVAHPGHLWFLLHILYYISMMIWPMIVLHRKLTDSTDPRWLAFRSSRFTPYLLISPLLLEGWLVNPEIYSAFAGSAHGFFNGWAAFTVGFAFVLIGEPLFKNLMQWRWMHIAIAFGLYLFRLEGQMPNVVIALESCLWLFAVFGFAFKHLRHTSPLLQYLNQSVFPVYIIHMVTLYGLSYFIVWWDIRTSLRFIIIFAGTVALSFLFFELVRRLKWIRPLFGLKLESASRT